MSLQPPTCPTISRMQRSAPGGTQSQSAGVTELRLPSSECQGVPANASSSRYRIWATPAVLILWIILPACWAINSARRGLGSHNRPASIVHRPVAPTGSIAQDVICAAVRADLHQVAALDQIRQVEPRRLVAQVAVQVAVLAVGEAPGLVSVFEAD